MNGRSASVAASVAAPVAAPVATARWRGAAAWGLACAVLLAVFAAYLQPDMAFTLANWAWSCL